MERTSLYHGQRLHRACTRAAFILLPFLAAMPSQAQVLTHGPVVGGVTASNANVFVRTDQAATVAIQYGTDSKLKKPENSQSFDTSEANDFTRIIPLEGLRSQKTIHLNVLVNGTPQFSEGSFPSFKTFPSKPKPRDFRFIVLTDFMTTSRLTNDVGTFANAANEKAAFAFIGGDFDHRDPGGIQEKREMFHDLYDPNTPFMSDFVRLILRQFAIARQWDDHDAGLNNIDKTYPDWAVSQQVFQEFTPTYPLPAVSPGIWQRFSYSHADFFILDCRSQRDVGTDPDGPDKSMLDGNALGSDGQLEWLKAGLLASTARWKIIFSSVITNPSTKLTDGWAAYQTEWNDLRGFIEQNAISGVLFITGDLHLGAIDDGASAGFPEMCVAKANGELTDTRCSSAATGAWSVGFYDNTCPGYGVVEVKKDSVLFKVKDSFGETRVSFEVSGKPDTKAPSKPKKLLATVGGPAQVDLSWRSSKDKVAVTGYEILRNDELLATVGAVTNHTDSTVSSSTSSEYAVRAFDRAGNVSKPSKAVTVIVP